MSNRTDTHPTTEAIGFRNTLLPLCAGALGGLAIVLAARWSAPAPAFAAVDLQSILSQRLATVSSQGLDATAAQRDAARFALALEHSLDELTVEHGAVLLSAPAVVRGVPDVTEALQRRLDVHLATAPQPATGARP